MRTTTSNSSMPPPGILAPSLHVLAAPIEIPLSPAGSYPLTRLDPAISPRTIHFRVVIGTISLFAENLECRWKKRDSVYWYVQVGETRGYFLFIFILALGAILMGLFSLSPSMVCWDMSVGKWIGKLLIVLVGKRNETKRLHGNSEV